MENDPRYQWLEKRITSCLNPKREALVNLVENEDNKLIFPLFNNLTHLNTKLAIETFFSFS